MAWIGHHWKSLIWRAQEGPKSGLSKSETRAQAASWGLLPSGHRVNRVSLDVEWQWISARPWCWLWVPEKKCMSFLQTSLCMGGREQGHHLLLLRTNRAEMALTDPCLTQGWRCPPPRASSAWLRSVTTVISSEHSFQCSYTVCSGAA